LNAWVRIEYHVKVVGTSSGVGDVKLFNSAESSTPTETISSTTANFGTLNITDLWFGHGTGAADGIAVRMDDIHVNNTGWAGPSCP
jgi:hypothetical protein